MNMTGRTERSEVGQTMSQTIRRAGVWRGSAALATGGGIPLSTVASGFPMLDAKLPGGGFPLGALTELLVPHPGIGELSLVLRAAAKLTRDRWLVFIAPPYVPYAPALAGAGIDPARVLVVHARDGHDRLWAVEQALRSGTCGAVLAWPSQADFKWLRRLQLAAESSAALGVLFMPARYETTASPAALRLALDARPTGLGVRVIKCRGGWPAAPVRLEVHRALAMSRSSVPVARGLHAR